MLTFDTPLALDETPRTGSMPKGLAAADNPLALALIDRIECGIAAVGPSGQLLYANRAARREFERAQALRLHGQHVMCAVHDTPEWRAALQDAAVRQRGRLLWLGGQDERLMVIVMPVQADELTTPAALLMLGRRSICSPLGLEMLATRHKLTFAERRVLAALVENQSTTEIAATHGVGMATIRTQIQSIRDKMQVRSIDALLLRAAEVPPVTALH
jgi:DNA-binding CsgD family transcriptional regulator